MADSSQPGDTGSPLTRLRGEIDKIDDRLLDLLNQRARLALDVGEAKKQTQANFYEPTRERAIIERLSGANAGPFPTEAIRPVFQEIISACLSIEQPLRIAYLGPEATFTHMACKRQFGLS